MIKIEQEQTRTNTIASSLQGTPCSNGLVPKIQTEPEQLSIPLNKLPCNPNRAKRLALRNEVTRDQCKKYLENKPDSSKIPKHLWDAENEAHSHLANHCQDFLNKQYRERSNS